MTAPVKTRAQMATRLEDVMTRSYYSLKEELRLERNHSLLKSYIIEAHQANEATHDEILKLLRISFRQSGRSKAATALTVAETEESDLFTVSGPTRSGILSVFVDTTDSRFWLIHAISKSAISDRAIHGIVEGSSSLDSAWMPIEFLNQIFTLGESRGIGLDFDRRYLDYIPRRSSKSEPIDVDDKRRGHERNPISTGDHLEYAKLQLWGAGSERILAALNEANLDHSTTLAKVRLRNEEDEVSERFALTDVKYDGKVTGRGSSFNAYNDVLLAVRNTYGGEVRKAEATYRVFWQGGASPKRSGEPFFIRLGAAGVSNLEHFCARVFSGADPFRLLALPVRRNPEFYTASAVDLHINQRIDFEITRKLLIAYLPSAACGNTLLRLYTNLQHYFSSDVKAINGSGKDVFAF